MTHHVMNQMGHGVPEHDRRRRPATSTQRVRPLLPGYMTMGQHGMGDMARDGHAPCRRTASRWSGGAGPFGYITWAACSRSSRCATALAGDGDPGWYEHPPGRVAVAATAEELRATAIELIPGRGRRE